ncbi:ERF family protein [Thermotalea metallivorans]|uniref:ERF superfamily protein n=1 Tax=Thermotalea metallivorans TaxID=520762 RepID=A0A140LCI7_9FIRM|nr:ERF family protein [Thermotalea metallivorans]KXG78262.1 hypothetical protein AN619_02370 [Thermotalea metallivorans]
MNRSDSIKNLAAALVKFNGEVSKIEKDSTNPHFKNKYASLDTIIDEIRPLLQKNGLSIIQMPGGDGDKFTMTTMLLHESGEWIESDPITMRPVKNDPQGIGSCTTYARRYSLAAFLSLNTGEDDDGNQATGNDDKEPDPAKKLSEAQVRRLYALGIANGYDPESIKRILIKKYQRTNAEDLTKTEYDQLIANIEANPKKWDKA